MNYVAADESTNYVAEDGTTCYVTEGGVSLQLVITVTAPIMVRVEAMEVD